MPYSHQVSFNNISPTYIDPSNPLHVPPQFKDNSNFSKKKKLDLNFGFGGGNINNIEQHYSSSDSHWFNQGSGKIRRLPPPPEKSILKKPHYNEIRYSMSLPADADADLAQVQEQNQNQDQSVDPAQEQVLGSGTADESFSPVSSAGEQQQAAAAALQQSQPTRHRKSFADMTIEELLALEKFYESHSKSKLDMNSFDFKTESAQLSAATVPSIAGNYGGGSNHNINNSNDINNINNINNSSNGAIRDRSTVIKSLTSKMYPTTPVITYGACCLTIKHKNYTKKGDLQDDSDLEAQNGYRTILTVITGRKHTWNSIDYITRYLVQDGDHIVITSHIPVEEMELDPSETNIIHHKKIEYDIEGFESSKTYNVSSTLIYEKCQNILDYTTTLLSRYNPDKKIRISAEIINCESSKQVFKSCYKLYQPCLIVIGSKIYENKMNRLFSQSSGSSYGGETLNAYPFPNMRKSSTSSMTRTVSSLGLGYNGSYKLDGVKCVKLTSYILSKSHVPVIVVTNEANEAADLNELNKFKLDIRATGKDFELKDNAIQAQKNLPEQNIPVIIKQNDEGGKNKDYLKASKQNENGVSDGYNVVVDDDDDDNDNDYDSSDNDGDDDDLLEEDDLALGLKRYTNSTLSTSATKIVAEDEDQEENDKTKFHIKNDQFAAILISISDRSRKSSIKDIKRNNQASTRSSISSGVQTPQSFYPTSTKVTFGDVDDFGNGTSCYKVKSLLGPSISNITTGSSISGNTENSSNLYKSKSYSNAELKRKLSQNNSGDKSIAKSASSQCYGSKEKKEPNAFLRLFGLGKKK